MTDLVKEEVIAENLGDDSEQKLSEADRKELIKDLMKHTKEVLCDMILELQSRSAASEMQKYYVIRTKNPGYNGPLAGIQIIMGKGMIEVDLEKEAKLEKAVEQFKTDVRKIDEKTTAGQYVPEEEVKAARGLLAKAENDLVNCATRRVRLIESDHDVTIEKVNF